MADNSSILKKAEQLGVLVLEPRDLFDAAMVDVLTTPPDDDWPRQTNTPCAQYSVARCIQALVEAEGMEEQDAREYIHYNTMGAWVGEGTPTFLDDDDGCRYNFD